MLADLAAEDDGDLVRPTDGAVCVQQTLTQLVERGAPVKDQVVAVLDLREEQAVLTPRLFALSFGKERGEASQPFLTTFKRSSAVSELASSCRRWGAAHLRKALEHCSKPTPSSRIRLASQWC